jgi:hypothetical protein
LRLGRDALGRRAYIARRVARRARFVYTNRVVRRCSATNWRTIESMSRSTLNPVPTAL